MLPSGFEPESTAREAVMIDRTTLREQNCNYPPDETRIIDRFCLSFSKSSIGIGKSLFSTINVSGFRFNFFNRSITVDPSFKSISFILFSLESLTLIFTGIDRDIKKGLIKLFTKDICCWGSQARTTAVASKATDAYASQGFKSLPQRNNFIKSNLL